MIGWSMDTSVDEPTPKSAVEIAKVERGSTLGQMREQKGISQEDAGKAAGVSRQTWSAWEKRTRPMSVTQLHRVIRLFDLSADAAVSLVQWLTTPASEAAGEPS